jgi:carbon-monoxide dehydrogenase medium subunit
MKPAPFEYLAPDTVDEALSILQEYGSDAKLLAGGQSLVPAMNFRLAQPGVLVDVNKLSSLNYIREDVNGGLLLGAMTRQSRLETDPLVSDRAPLLYEAMPRVAHPQIRNRGTLGGSLAHADPAAELPVIAVALGARFRIRSARRERWIRADDFFQGLFTTALEPEEMLVEVELPVLSPGTGWSFMEVARRHGDYALMGVAVLVSLEGQGVCTTARIVLLNAGDRPVEAREAGRTLAGERLEDAAIEAASALAAGREIEPWGNVHASPEYQRHLALVLTRRALKQAAKRAALPAH